MDVAGVIVLVVFLVIIGMVINAVSDAAESRGKVRGLTSDEKDDLRPAEKEFFQRFGSDSDLLDAFGSVGCVVEVPKTVKSEDGSERVEVEQHAPTILRRFKDNRGVGLVLSVPIGMSVEEIVTAVGKFGCYADIEGVKDYAVERESAGRVRFYALTRESFENSLGVDFLD